jgi:hypothetical protein
VLHSSGSGAVAQLGERRVRNAKVGSSILLRSTKNSRLYEKNPKTRVAARLCGFLFEKIKKPEISEKGPRSFRAI